MSTVALIGVDLDTVVRVSRLVDPMTTEVRELHLNPASPDIGEIIAAQPTVTVLGPAIEHAVRAQVTQSLETNYPSNVTIWSDEAGQTDLRTAMSAGARDQFAADASDEQISEILGRAVQLGQARTSFAGAAGEAVVGPESTGRVIVVMSPKGGSGKTMLSTNLASIIASNHPGEVLLVDLDLQFGDDAGALGVTPRYSIVDAVQAVHDSTALKAMLTPHESGLFLLAAPPDPVSAEDVDPAAVRELIGALRQQFPTVIIDTGAGIEESTLVALEHATDVCFITTTDLAAIQALRKADAAIEALDLTNNRRFYVLNRSNSDVGVRQRDIEEVTGLAIDATIPSSKQVPTSMNQGRPVAEQYRRGGVAKSLAKIAEIFMPEAALATSRRS